MKVRVTQMADGALRRFTPAPGRAMEAAYARHCEACPEWRGRPYVDVAAADLPPAGDYRLAWRLVDGKITVDLPAARAIKLALIRAARNARFAPFDAEWMKATAKGDTIAAALIDAKREMLRNAPEVAEAALAGAKTLDAVAAYEPVWP